ncbi:MAG: DUF4304 domain-containing protein, partial [Planctomycetota bacterium]
MAKKKNPWPGLLTKIQRNLEPLLEEAGFGRETSRTYSRKAERGLVHVIHFKMGHMEHLAGMFTVNLGVHVPQEDGTSLFLRPYVCAFAEQMD